MIWVEIHSNPSSVLCRLLDCQNLFTPTWDHFERLRTLWASSKSARRHCWDRTSLQGGKRAIASSASWACFAASSSVLAIPLVFFTNSTACAISKILESYLRNLWKSWANWPILLGHYYLTGTITVSGPNSIRYLNQEPISEWCMDLRADIKKTSCVESRLYYVLKIC